MDTATLIDAHCHLDFEAFDEDRAQVLERSDKNNISDIIIPGTERKYWQRINKLCHDHSHLHACYGLHPYWVGKHEKKDLTHLALYINNHVAVAVGECGLDFRQGQADKDTQLLFFESQLDIAESLNLPVIIHSVKATETVINSLKKFKNIKGMVHSYSGSYEQAMQIIDMGFYISISARITYDNAKKIQRVIKQIPLTSLLLETDAPDQPGVKHINKRNEPAFLIETLHAVTALRDETIEVTALQTTKNARKLFGI